MCLFCPLDSSPKAGQAVQCARLPLRNSATRQASTVKSSLYQPLEDSTPVPGQPDCYSWPIRILELHPLSHGSDLCCSLITTTIGAERNGYEALSYVWGDGDPSKTLLVNSQQILVTQKLHDVLVNLRHQKKLRRIWVDAICINQDDVVERNIQVSRMTAIYQCAWRTVMYLGGKDRTTKKAVRFIENLAQTVNSRPTALSHILRDRRYETHWHALRELLELPYWRRIWVVQEVAVAQDVLMLVGRYRIAFERFQELIYALAGLYMRSIHCDVHISLPSLRLNNIWALLEARRLYQSSSPPRLTELLVLFLSSFSSDPRDKVYALYSMCPTSNMPLPDYQLDPWAVFASTVHISIEQCNNLNILSAINPGIGYPHFPSWCPILNGPSPSPFPFYVHEWRCAGSRGPEVEFRDGGTTMLARGFLVDHIKYVCKTERIGFEDTWLETVATAAGSAEQTPYKTEEDWRLALLDTLLLDSPAAILNRANESKDWDESSKIYSVWYPVRLLEERLVPWLYPSSVLSGLDVARRVVRNIAKNNSFFITESGYIGLAPETVRKGDAVLVLFGSPVPFCVRRVGKATNDAQRWRFVGDCYCHGIMRGEAVSLLEEGKFYERGFSFL